MDGIALYVVLGIVVGLLIDVARCMGKQEKRQQRIEEQLQRIEERIQLEERVQLIEESSSRSKQLLQA